MLLNRRSLFALAAGMLSALTVRAKAEAPATIISKEISFPIPPRGTLTPMCLRVVDGACVIAHDNPLVEQISTGHSLVPLDSEEGQRILNESAVTAPQPRSFPRGTVVTGAGMPDMISDGHGVLYLIEGPDGQAILNSMAANLRSDGTLRHRQHHSVDFPPHRQ